MSLTNKGLDQIREADLSDLISAGVSEGLLYEYKSEMYGNSDAEVKEYLKDLSSLANMSGGHLIIGMEEIGGVATAIKALLRPDADKEIQRLENLARDGLEPRIVGVQMRAIPIVSGGFVVVVRVPKSWNPPHRVSARNTNRIYLRNSSGAHEASVEELRVLFTQGASIRDRVRAFRAERLGRVASGDAVIPLADSASRLILHLVPLSAFSGQHFIDLERAQAVSEKLVPIGASGYSPEINFDGFMNRRGSDKSFGYTHIFRDGIIEATKVELIIEREGKRFIPSQSFDESILNYLPNYMSALSELQVAPPIMMMISLQGVRGAHLGISQVWDEPRPFIRDTLELPGITFDSFGDAHFYQKQSRPAFDALWNAAGFAKSLYFDHQDRWVGPKR
jgi:hypothetical protein